MERRQYRNPPIEEAICEIRFVPGPVAEFTAPARFYESIRNAYPGDPRHQQLMAAELLSRPAGSQMSVRPEGVKILFPDQDGRRLVGLGQHVLSVHVLRPYPGWEEFSRRIATAFQAYQTAAAPAGVRRIAVRYINRIEIRSETVRLGEYLTVAPRLPDGVLANIRTFVTRLESLYEDQPIQLILTIANAEPSAPGTAALLMDIDVFQEWSSDPLPLGEVLGVVEELKRREREAFEALITDSSRELFDE